MRMETDKELLDSYVASGDESAFAELVARYGPMAYRTCRRLLGNDHDAEDGFSGQEYFPDGMKRGVYYHPVERGFERELKRRLDYFVKLRGKRQS